MKLPNADDLIVEEEKIAGYLLNPKHRYGAAKAAFFMTLGFRLQEWNILADALREHGRSHEIKSSRETGFGPRYLVEGTYKHPVARRLSFAQFGSSMSAALLHGS